MFNLKMGKSKNYYPQVVLEIHNEFFTMSDKILAEAKNILANASDNSFKKAMRLKLIGFNNVPEVINGNKIENDILLTKEASKNIDYYKSKYPFYKFITIEGVNSICHKYGLVCAPIERFKGFVPERNLIEIESFKINNNDISYTSKSQSTYPIKEGSIFDDNGESAERHSSIYKKIKVYHKMQICAPKIDMELSGLYMDHYIAKEPVKVPDPIVLQPVNGGYLIVTAWGDESSDELVINEIRN